MNRPFFRPFWVHLKARARACLLKARARACLRSPTAWIILLFFGLTAVIFWPAVPGTSNPLQDPDEGLPLLMMLFLWLYLWSAPPMMVIRGRTTDRRGEAPLGVCAAPALPVGPRTRAVAEAILALAALGAIRWTAMPIYQSVWSMESVWATIAGAFFLFPMAVVWALPVRNPNTFMVRPIIIAVATGIALVGGFFATWPGIVLGGLGLSVVALLIAPFELPEFQGKTGLRGATHRSRKRLEPQRQLSRDAWLPLFKTWGPWVFFAALVYGVCMLLDVRGDSWQWILFGGFQVFLVITLQPMFRPFNSNLLAESLVGKHRVSRGDFMQSWRVLPVGREAVLRRVWAHGALVGLMLWAVPVTILVVRHRLLEGFWSFKGGVGGLMQFVVVGALFVPVLAGVLVAVALGRRLEIALSGLSLLLGIHVLFIVRILLQETFGRGSLLATGGTLFVLTFLIAAGSLPPLRFLHRAPEPL